MNPSHGRRSSPPPKSHAVIASRGSALALWQANHVLSLLSGLGVTGEILVLKTTADRIQDRFLHEIGGKGLFIRELEQALTDGRADLAIHSLKDMPAALAPEYALPAILPRHAPTDVLILREDLAARHALPAGPLSVADVQALGALTVGTGSLRRQALLARHAPRIGCVGVRGNVDTRLRKLEEGAWDALILAEASLQRLGIRHPGARTLDPAWFTPSPSQGALAMETLAQSPWAPWLHATLNDASTAAAVAVERGLLAALGGDCTLPFGCHATAPDLDGTSQVDAVVLARDGSAAMARTAGRLNGESDRHALIGALRQGLRAAGVADIMNRLALTLPADF